VLEVGEGTAARAHLRRNPQADVVVVGGLHEVAGRSPQVLGRFDAILLSSGLDAKDASRHGLRILHGLLTENGRICARVRNGGHWSQFERLLSEAGSTREATSTEDTPLLTWPQAARLFRQSALRLEQVRACAPDDVEPPPWLVGLSSIAQQAGARGDAFQRSLRVSDFLVTACRAEPTPRPKLRLHYAIFAPRLMDARTRVPAQALSSDSELVVSYRERSADLPKAPAAVPKIIILQRVFFQPAVLSRIVSEARAAGWLLVYEIDDHPDLIAQVNEKPGMAELIRGVLRGCHAVQTSTQELANVLRALNPEVHTFSNAAFDLPPFRLRPQVRKVFYGALNRGEYSVAVARNLGAAVNARPDLEFRIVHDRAFFDALPTDRKTYERTLDYPAYLEAMQSSDVVLCPLEGAPSELFKSDLKFVEAARAGAAVIASPAVYERTIRCGETGLIARDMDEWGSHLTRVTADPELRNRLARAAWDYVRAERMAWPQLLQLKRWYSSLVERREALDQALLQRCPQLRG
jgi:hypothetical protein